MLPKGGYFFAITFSFLLLLLARAKAANYCLTAIFHSLVRLSLLQGFPPVPLISNISRIWDFTHFQDKKRCWDKKHLLGIFNNCPRPDGTHLLGRHAFAGTARICYRERHLLGRHALLPRNALLYRDICKKHLRLSNYEISYKNNVFMTGKKFLVRRETKLLFKRNFQ